MKQWNLNGMWELCQYPYRETLPETEAALGAPERTLTGTVPGDVLSDLTAAGLLPDVNYGMNATKAEWALESDWCYRTAFTLDTPPERETELVFEGLDTFAAVYVNGERLGETDNMFIPHRFSVNGRVREGKNTVAVYLRSIRHSMARYPQENYESLFSTPRIFVRKAQCQFSWDWAPDLPSMGIWKSVRLETRPGFRFLSHRFETRLDGQVTLFFEIDSGEMLHAGEAHRAAIRLTVHSGEQPLTVDFPFDDYRNFVTFTVPQPRLWWPHDMGEPFLYPYTLSYFEDGQLSDEVTGRFAIRTVSIDETPRPGEDGLKFELRVNGEPVFAKGANWVPMDLMPGTVTKERYERALCLLREGHMNFLRVWGGGIYEKDVFYDLCDEYGILIWQDFAFSCAEIPDEYPGLMTRITAELESIVRRLSHHPCIALWCGGNERTGSLGYWPCKGVRQFDYLFRGIAQTLDPSRPYVPNSPFGYTNLCNDALSGDTHTASFSVCVSQNTPLDRRAIAQQKVGFATEIAIMGFPPLSSLEKFVPPDQLAKDSETLNFHFRYNPYDPNTCHLTFLQQEVQLAETMFGPAEDMAEFVKRSMCVQNEFVYREVTFHRSRKGTCAGALLWMYNDIWPCGTWSIVDYYLEPKSAYYAMKRACAPVGCYWVEDENGGIRAFLVNDTRKAAAGTVTVRQAQLDGTVLAENSFAADAPALASQMVFDAAAFDLSRRDTYLFVEFAGEGRAVYDTLLLGSFREIVWPDPELTVAAERVTATDLAVTLTAKAYARCVRLSGLPERTYYSDNYLDIPAGQTVTVTVRHPDGLDPAALRVDHWLTPWDG